LFFFFSLLFTMSNILQKIKDIEDEMAHTQRNKATEAHLGLLKARLAKLRRELLAPVATKSGGGEGFDVTKAGDARVGLIGFPSVGKSTLLNQLTSTFSEVAAYEFTTLTCIPGVIQYKGARIQLLDLPGIIEGAKDGKGRGKQVIAVARTCNLLLIILDSSKPLKSKLKIMNELEGFGIRLNKKPANITFKRKDKGGIVITNTVPLTKINEDIVKSILTEYKISNAEICFKCNASADDLIDIIEGNRTYVPALYVLNKVDQITLPELEILGQLPHCIPVSGMLRWNLEGLKEKIWQYLNLIRLYTKPRGSPPDYEAPVVIRQDKATVEGFCNRIHRKIMEQFKYAVVWGTSVKHNPQRVGKDHVLADEDVVQIVKRITA